MPGGPHSGAAVDAPARALRESRLERRQELLRQVAEELEAADFDQLTTVSVITEDVGDAASEGRALHASTGASPQAPSVLIVGGAVDTSTAVKVEAGRASGMPRRVPKKARRKVKPGRARDKGAPHKAVKQRSASTSAAGKATKARGSAPHVAEGGPRTKFELARQMPSRATPKCAVAGEHGQGHKVGEEQSQLQVDEKSAHEAEQAKQDAWKQAKLEARLIFK